MTGNYRIKGSKVDYEKALHSLQCPVLALTFSGDRWSPELSAKALLGKLPQRTAVHWHLGPADTEGQLVDHYSWIKQPHLVTPAVARHIRQQR
jgi:pimeloyl-ACP methyl ester carboxylesterase